MEKKNNTKIQAALRGFRYAIYYALLLAVVLSVPGLVVALIRHHSILRSLTMAYYYGGGFVLLVSIPQLYRREQPGSDGKKRSSVSDALFGFYGWNDVAATGGSDGDQNQMLSGVGFWLGIQIFVTGVLLLSFGLIMELLFF